MEDEDSDVGKAVGGGAALLACPKRGSMP